MNRHAFTCQQFEELAPTFDHKSELINGDIIVVPPMRNPHSEIQQQLCFLLSDHFGRKHVRMVGSVQNGEYDLCEPDVYILKKPMNHSKGYVDASNVWFVAEIADTTLDKDLSNDGTSKLSVFARANIPTAWVVDVNKKCIHEFTYPNTQTGVYENYAWFTDSLELKSLEINVVDVYL